MNTLFKITLLFSLLFCYLFSSAENDLKAKRAVLKNHITTNFPDQFTNPQKKNRKCLCQFGYDLSLFKIPLFSITGLIDTSKLGIHSYGKPNLAEKNGTMYTCNGGFIDLSHLRAAVDWTVYLAFNLVIDSSSNLNLPDEGGVLKIRYRKEAELSLEDIGALAQKIAFERLVWHEVASWYYHMPNYIIDEQQSTFSPEDLYSDFLGTVIGKNIALRILNERETLSYAQIATKEIEKTIATLHPLGKDETKLAYDIVDRHKQLMLPVNERNSDVWFDSNIVFGDTRYLFKRYTNTGPAINPWLVPDAGKLGCSVKDKPEVFMVPKKTKAGIVLNHYYKFYIHPDSNLFFAKITGKQLQPPFANFATQYMSRIVAHVSKSMKETLHTGFNKRNRLDPVPGYKKVRRTF